MVGARDNVATSGWAEPERPRQGGVVTILAAAAPAAPASTDDRPAPLAAMALPSWASGLASDAVAAASEKASKAVDGNPELAAIAANLQPPKDKPDRPAPEKRAGSATGRQGDPDVAYAFDVQIGGVSYGMFCEISGLNWRAEVQPMPEGGNNVFVRSLIRPGKFDMLTLKRGWIATTGEFIDLLRGVLDPTQPMSRANVTIAILSRNYEEVGRYDLARAAVIEYEGPTLNAMSGQLGFEQIRLIYDSFTYTPRQ